MANLHRFEEIETWKKAREFMLVPELATSLKISVFMIRAAERLF